MSPFDLSGKHILITGASSGIGKSTALLCSQLGGILSIVGRNRQRLDDTMSQLRGEGHQMFICDLSEETQVANLMDSIQKLDGIVYCAGTIQTCITRNLTKKLCQDLFNANFYSAVTINTLLLSNKKINKNASFVFVSSLSAFKCAEFGNAAYGASKAALASYAKILALELSGRGCRVNIVSPGMVMTPLLEKFDVDIDQFLEDEKKYPLGYGKPEYVANAIVFLLSDGARWITGTDMILDGGLTLR